MTDDWRIRYADPISNKNWKERLFQQGLSLDDVLKQCGIPREEVDLRYVYGFSYGWSKDGTSSVDYITFRNNALLNLVENAQREGYILVMNFDTKPGLAYDSTDPKLRQGFLVDCSATGIIPKDKHKGDV